MTLALGQIGFFQLSNLVRNKVPFSFFLMGVNLPENLTGDLKQLMAKGISTSASDLIKVVDSMKLSPDHPIVLMCASGAEAAEFSALLAGKGFLNVYSVKNGWIGLLEDAKAEGHL